MKQLVKHIKSLSMALKDLEGHILNGEQLQTGRLFESVGLLPREVLANWLLCAVLNFTGNTDRFTFTSSPSEGDGRIYDAESKDTHLTEHTMIPKQEGASDALILEAIEKKIKKGGAAYAAGKTLVVFINASFRWFPNRVARQLPENLHFNDVWVVSRRDTEDSEHVYIVTSLDLSEGDAPVWLVRIKNDFNSWQVERFQ